MSVAVLCLLAAPMARAAEHITLKNGFELDCSRRETSGDHVRLYLANANSTGYLEVASDAIVHVEPLPEAPPQTPTAPAPHPATSTLSATEMSQLLARAGAEHHIDVDMLASVIHAESGGQLRAVSRTGAKGLMQLMPATAAHLGVTDAFQADQNIAGGTAYLDSLLIRYHDNIVLALAAYNAGPGAVDRWHGIPPYAETQAYVVRVIREFNRRKQMALTASSR
ncbi:MAG TPA: lytic transglycosylase domain-containing protein [Granulicella sp.]